MANQITVQVYAIDNIPQRNALNVSFPTNQISAQLATSVLATNIQSQINYYPNPNNQAQLTEVLVSQSISDIATLAGTSMFAASIYKINGYPQGGQALNMLFPSVQPSIWNVSGGGDVHSFVQFKGKKYYAHETGAALATAANTADGGGGGVTNITYAALVTAIGASGLTAGQQYRIADYATVHYIVDAAGTQYLGSIITGVNEPLIVTASSSNTLEPVAYSALHPEDIIHYDWNPANWIDDLSFADLSGTSTIITGFKGVIYFRHDTLLDNYMGYDFRNCKFRRWKTNVSAWDSGTTYAAGDFVSFANYIWVSVYSSNTNHSPDLSANYWCRLLDLTATEYYNNSPTSTNGITSGADFADFKTFAEGAGTATYEISCRSNHFEGFKDNYTFDDVAATILSNNVFFLQDEGYFTLFSNTIGHSSFANTVVCKYAFNNNTIGNYFKNNIVDKGQNNTIQNDCKNNIIINIGYYVVGNLFSFNKIESGTGTNVIGNSCHDNIIKNAFQSNTIGNSFGGNFLGFGFNSNTIGNSFGGNIVIDEFTENQVCDEASISVDYTSATHVYGDYNTRIFRRADGTVKLSYCDNSDVIQVVNANA